MVSNPNGLQRPSQLSMSNSLRYRRTGFKPQRASEAIPTYKKGNCWSLTHGVSNPNGLHRPSQHGAVRKAIFYIKVCYKLQRASEAIPTSTRLKTSNRVKSFKPQRASEAIPTC